MEEESERRRVRGGEEEESEVEEMRRRGGGEEQAYSTLTRFFVIFTDFQPRALPHQALTLEYLN